MMNKTLSSLLSLLLLLTACQSRAVVTAIPTAAPADTATVQVPTPTTAAPTSTPRPGLPVHYNPEDAGSAFQLDFRSEDLSDLDLREASEDLLHSDFSTQTKWPDAEWLPQGFDPQQIIEYGKDPGLGVRSLHEQGITGKGVSIAIIDQPLTPVNHVEYDGRVKVNEPIGNPGGMSMHGPAVASIAVGKTVGVAPEANLYFFAAEIPFTEKDGRMIRNFSYIAQAVRRILEINEGLSDDEKIRVISLSIGWGPDEPGYDEIVAAVEAAKEAGIFVVSSSLEDTYIGYKFQGLGREPLGDPNALSSYAAGSFWAGMLAQPGAVMAQQSRVLVPMDSRTYASYLGKEEYNWGRTGGWSWSIPYIAGLYALAVQVNPDVTPAKFWDVVRSTALPFKIPIDGKDTQIGMILQPVAVIEKLK